MPVTAEVYCRTACYSRGVRVELCLLQQRCAVEGCLLQQRCAVEGCLLQQKCAVELPVTAEVEGCLLQQGCAVELPVTTEVEGCLLQQKCAAEVCLLQQCAVWATFYSRLCLLQKKCAEELLQLRVTCYNRTSEMCSRGLPVETEVFCRGVPVYNRSVK